MFGKYLEMTRKTGPLVHNITNYVTVNDCANILLACGAAPIMADDLAEVGDITSICGALNINIGTLNQRTIPSMFAAGKKAAALRHPLVLDPVGAGASPLRTDTAKQLIAKIPFTAIRGNISEIKALALGAGGARGVDADIVDAITEDSLGEAVSFSGQFAERTGAILAVTGSIDIITDGKTTYVLRNGHPMLGRITGSGCMLSALLAAFLAANPENRLEAAAAAVCLMGLAGEMAKGRLGDQDGNAAFRQYLIDAVCNMTGEMLDRGEVCEIR